MRRHWIAFGTSSTTWPAERLAHSIKGSAAIVSGDASSKVALEMEMGGRTGNLHAMSAKLVNLERQFQAARDATLSLFR